jgi:hypothetical protein
VPFENFTLGDGTSPVSTWGRTYSILKQRPDTEPGLLT